MGMGTNFYVNYVNPREFLALATICGIRVTPRSNGLLPWLNCVVLSKRAMSIPCPSVKSPACDLPPSSRPPRLAPGETPRPPNRGELLPRARAGGVVSRQRPGLRQPSGALEVVGGGRTVATDVRSRTLSDGNVYPLLMSAATRNRFIGRRGGHSIRTRQIKVHGIDRASR